MPADDDWRPGRYCREQIGGDNVDIGYETIKRFDETLERIENKLNRVLALLSLVLKEEKKMSRELDDLTTQVRQNTDLEQGAITLIKGLADQITASKDDPAKLTALTNELKTKADALAAAITANTPLPPQTP